MALIFAIYSIGICICGFVVPSRILDCHAPIMQFVWAQTESKLLSSRQILPLVESHPSMWNPVCFSIYIMIGGWYLVLHSNTIGMIDIRIWICECSCNPEGMVCAFTCKSDCEEISSIYIFGNSKRLSRTISPTTNMMYISSKFLAQCPIFVKPISFRRSEP